MMTKEDQEFNVDFDQKEQDDAYAREILEQKVDSLGWKVALTAIIVPCLIGVIVVIGYFHIQKQVKDFRSTGAAEVRELTNDLEAKVNALEARQQKLNAKITDVPPAIEKNANAIDAAEKRARSAAVTANRADKAADAVEKKAADTAAAVKRMENTVGGVEKTVAGLQSDIKALQNDLAAVKGNIKSMADKLAALEKEKASRDELGRVLSNQTRTYAEKLETTTAEWEKRISGIENRLSGLEKTLESPETGDSKTEQPPSSEPAPAAPQSAPGGIKEEPLTQ